MSSRRSGFPFGSGQKSLLPSVFRRRRGSLFFPVLPLFLTLTKRRLLRRAFVARRFFRSFFHCFNGRGVGSLSALQPCTFEGFKLLSVRGLAVRLHYGLSDSHSGGSKRFNLYCELLHRRTGVVIQAGGRTRSSPFLTTIGRRGKVFLLHIPVLTPARWFRAHASESRA